MRWQRSTSQSNTARHPRGFVLSAIFLALVLVAGLVLTVLRLTESNDDPTATQEQSSVSTQPGTDEPCSGPVVQSSETPPDVSEATWSLVGTVAAPQLDGAGPSARTATGIPRCFSGNPSGAVLAAANYIAFGTGRPDLAVELATGAVAPGAGQVAAVEAAKTASTTASARLQIVGYRLDSYSPELTIVVLVVEAEDGSFVSGDLALTWADSDWKLIADPVTGSTANLRPLSNLGGFIPWGAS